jgi:hypothetical protein
VEPAHGLGHELLVGRQVVELAAAAQQQSLVQTALQTALARLDGAVLVAHPGVVARGSHAVVPAQRLVASGQFLAIGQVVERRRQAVGAVLLGHAAGHPQRVLQTRSQALEALAAQHHPRMAPAAMRQRELVQPVREHQPAQADIQFVGHGEVRQPQPAGRVLLREVDLALAAVLGTPLADAPLQRAQHRVGEPLGVTTLQLLEHRHPHQRRRAFEHGHHLGIPHLGQRVGAGAPVPRWAL